MEIGNSGQESNQNGSFEMVFDDEPSDDNSK